jgi:transmembrane sensor
MTKKDKKEHIWPVLVRYLDNTMSESDSLMLEEWLEESNENRRILHSVDRIWKAAEDKTQETLIKELNLEKDWELVSGRIDKSNPEEKRERIRNFRKLRKRHQLFSNLLKAAAILLVAVSSAMLTLKYAPVQESGIVQAPVFNEIITKPGERATVELGDGTKVFLNADSKLIMPKTFSQNKREVELIGQAFFDVKSDRNRPFHIQTKNAVIEVLGTSFDVRSYQDEAEMKVAVRDGTVELRRHDDSENRLIVNGGYRGTVSETKGLLAVELVDDPDLYFGWMDGRLIFRDTPIHEVISHIERWYDVSITYDLSDETIKNKRFTADLKTRSVREVLEVIQMSMNLGFEIDGDEIIITDEPV